jgi:hypothetical protein
MIALLVIITIIAAVVSLKIYSDKKRREYLLAKYGSQDIVDRIMKKLVWQGMSQDQLLDSWGRPAAKDQNIYKTKVAETFKYNQYGKNRFHNRVRVENGFVVGWERK